MSVAQTTPATRGRPHSIYIVYIVLVFSLLVDGLPLPIGARSPKIFVSEFILILLCFRAVILMLRNPRRLQGRDLWQISGFGLFATVSVLYVLSTAVATVASTDILRSIAFQRTIFESALIVFVAWFDFVDNPIGLRRVVLAIVFFGAILGAITMLNAYQALNGNTALLFNWTKSYEVKGKIEAVGLKNNAISALLVFALGIAFGTVRAWRGFFRWAQIAAVVVMGAALLVTSSSGATVSLLAGILLVLLLRHPLGAFLLAVVVSIIGIGVAGIISFEAVAPIVTKMAYSFQQRLNIVWIPGVEAFGAYPLFGIGRGVSTDIFETGLHNSILTAFVESGIWSGMLFLVMLLLIFARLFAIGLPLARTNHTRAQRHAAFLVLGIQTSVLVFLIDSMGEIVFDSVRHSILFWLVIGLAYAVPVRRAIVWRSQPQVLSPSSLLGETS